MMARRVLPFVCKKQPIVVAREEGKELSGKFFPDSKANSKASALGDEPSAFPVEIAREEGKVTELSGKNFPDSKANSKASSLGDEPHAFPVEIAREEGKVTELSGKNFPDTKASVLGDEPPAFERFNLLSEEDEEELC